MRVRHILIMASAIIALVVLVGVIFSNLPTANINKKVEEDKKEISFTAYYPQQASDLINGLIEKGYSVKSVDGFGPYIIVMEKEDSCSK